MTEPAYGVRMRSRGRVSTAGAARRVLAGLLAVLAAAGAGTLAGCTPTPTIVAGERIAVWGSPSPAPPRPSSPPVFASDALALAAASRAFTAYQAASDAVTAAGGRGPERVQPLVSVQYWPTELAALRSFERNGETLTGSTTFDSARLVRYSDTVAGAEVRLVVCTDLSLTRLIDAAGEDVTPPLRPGRLAVQLDFISSETDARTLLLDGERPRNGTDEC